VSKAIDATGVGTAWTPGGGSASRATCQASSVSSIISEPEIRRQLLEGNAQAVELHSRVPMREWIGDSA